MSTDLADELDSLAAFADAVEEHIAAEMDEAADVDNVYYVPDDDVVHVGLTLTEYESPAIKSVLGDDVRVESEVDLELELDLASGEADASVNGVTSE